MKNNENKWCKKTKKYCYSSQAKARRAVRRYDDIKREYYCEYCDSFHTTSMPLKLFDPDISEPKKKKVKMENITSRLKFLISKTKEE